MTERLPKTVVLVLSVLAVASACVAAPAGSARRAADEFGRPTASVSAVGGILSGGRTSVGSWASVTAAARESVIRVRNRTCDGLDTGSGFVVAPRTVLTNAHVVRGGVQLSLNTADGLPVSATSVDILSGEDLAVIHTAATLPPPLNIAAQDPVPGDLTEALGYPLGRKFAVASGRIVSFSSGKPYAHNSRVLRSSVEIHPGNSGGPLINSTGQVVGVVTAIDLNDGIAIAIPDSRVRERLSAAKRLPVTHSCH